MAKYYNGVRLPDLPADVLAAYPYAWIRKNTTSGYYDLLFSDKPFYYQQTSNGVYDGTEAAGKPWYRVPIATADTAASWTNNTSSNTYSYWGIDDARTVLWSNHDMPYNSATAAFFYIRGSEPVDTLAPEGKVYYNGVLLPAIPQGVLGGYPYVWIRRNEADRVYELMCHPNGAHYRNTSVADKGVVSSPRYKVAMDADADRWTFADRSYYGYTIDNTKKVMWSNCDIPNDYETALGVYFYASEPIPESGAKLVGLDYETYYKFFVGLNSIVYDGNASAVNYAVPVEKDCIYRVDVTEVGNRLRAAFTTTDPSTITADVAAKTIMYNPTTFSAGFTFANPAPADGWLLVYVSNAGETPDISIAKVVLGAEDEERIFGMAKINGVSQPITGGMTKLNGVVLPITGGMTKINGVVTRIAVKNGDEGAPVLVTVTGTGDESYCYAIIGGTKFTESSDSIAVSSGDIITFGIYGANSVYNGWVKIDGVEAIVIENKKSATYDWTVPDGITEVTIKLKCYNDAATTRRGRITVTTV